jgi:hypothetical protein
MALFPPGKGGGEGVAYGYKGKGVTIHSIVEGSGRPVGIRSTPANSSERDEVCPLVDALPVKPHAIQADKGYDATWLRWWLERCRGIKARIAKREYPKPKTYTPIAGSTRWRVERAFAWYQRKYRRITAKWERKWSPWMGFLNLALIHYWVTVLVG